MTVLPEDSAGRRLRAALRRLLGAYESAGLLGRPAREFAVPRDRLLATGLDDDALERLAAAGYVEEVPAGVGAGEGFALTESGAALAREQEGRGVPPPEGAERAERAPAEVPHWDEDERKLTYHRHLVKQFTRKAPGQFRVLRAFQASHWASVIDNPFGSGRAADKLLSNAVKGLNRRLKSHLLRFELEDDGRRVRWVAGRPRGPRRH